jgi:hypothetical protein
VQLKLSRKSKVLKVKKGRTKMRHSIKKLVLTGAVVMVMGALVASPAMAEDNNPCGEGQGVVITGNGSFTCMPTGNPKPEPEHSWWASPWIDYILS